jgi:indole-3-glycerol phosphate synthase/phosphoribosylanthranilate isomerase
VLDNGQGGTGQRFDWSLLQGEKLDNVCWQAASAPITV